MLSECLRTGAIWKKLNYQIGSAACTLNADPNLFTCQISLIDKSLNSQMYEDVIVGTRQIYSFNNISVSQLDELIVEIKIDDTDIWAQADSLNVDNRQIEESVRSLFNSLNYLMLCNYLKLEDDYPLVFSYYSRTVYVNSFELMSSVQESLMKSRETKSILKQELIIGFLRQISAKSLKRYLIGLTSRNIEKMELLLRYKGNNTKTEKSGHDDLFSFEFFKYHTV